MTWPNVSCRNVYFIRQSCSTLVKVGYSINPYSRLSQLQCANARELRLEYIVPTIRFRELERCLHVFLTAKGQHVRGEWFNIGVNDNYEHLINDALGPRENISN